MLMTARFKVKRPTAFATCTDAIDVTIQTSARAGALTAANLASAAVAQACAAARTKSDNLLVVAVEVK